MVRAAIPLAGRALPVAWGDCEYPWKTLTPPSPNTLERYLLTWLGAAGPPGVRLILVFDRGYARVELVQDFNRGGQPFLIRAPAQVIVEAEAPGRRQRWSLGRRPPRSGQPRRYRPVLYPSREAEPVDVIVYRERGFAPAGFLLVPPDSESGLPTEEVVRLYRQRMQIEQCFRDWKSPLGLRGLRLQGQKPERQLRLLRGFTLAYLLVRLLGQYPLAEKLRPYFEARRRCSRHGTRKVLSALSIALSLLSDARGASPARQRLMQILSHLASGRAVASLTAFSP